MIVDKVGDFKEVFFPLATSVAIDIAIIIQNTLIKNVLCLAMETVTLDRFVEASWAVMLMETVTKMWSYQLPVSPVSEIISKVVSTWSMVGFMLLSI